METYFSYRNLLFERLWDGLEYNEDTVYRDIFLHELSAVIIEEKLLEIPPAIMQQLVIHMADLHLWKVRLLHYSVLSFKSPMTWMYPFFFFFLVGT